MDDQFVTKKQFQTMANMVVGLHSQLITTQAAIRALLIAHPNRDQAISTVNTELLRWESTGLHSQIPDSFFADFERAKMALLPSEEDLRRSA